MLRPVNARNEDCIALISRHAELWPYDLSGHQQLCDRIKGLVQPGIYHRAEPSLQPAMVDVIGTYHDTSTGNEAFVVAYVTLNGGKESLHETVVPIADFLAEFVPGQLDGPCVLGEKIEIDAPEREALVLH